jgi:hypothetical protein
VHLVGSRQARCLAVSRNWSPKAFLGLIFPEDVTSSLRRLALKRGRPGPAATEPPRCMSPHFSVPPEIGGCEGFAMLNRTNRTESANSNRLNLGTRSLALKTGANMGLICQRIRHAHPARMVPVHSGLAASGRYRATSDMATPAMPDSSLVSPRLFTSCGIRPRVAVRAEAVPVERSVVTDDRVCHTGLTRGSSLPKPPTKPGQSPRKPRGQRSWRAWQGSDAVGSMPRPTLAAAAAAAPGAASGG